VKVFIDAHAHLDRYEDALDAALAEIERHGILTVSNSMDVGSYQRNREIAGRCEWVLPTFGVHPWNAVEYVDHLGDLHAWVEESPMLGEVGLDYHFVEDASQYPAQRKVFEFFLRAAKEQNKIVSLHTKGAERDILHLLERHDIERVIVHWYSGPLDVFHELLARGFYFTIGIEVRYSRHIQLIAREVPLAQLLTETDNPGGPRSLIGKPGMPMLIRDVVETLAELRGTSAEAVVEAVQSNFAECIWDDPWLSETYGGLLASRRVSS